MGAMNSPDSTLRRDRGGLQMTNSQSGVVNSCFRFRRCCSRYRHSDNHTAKSALPVIPISTRLHQEVENRVAEQQQCNKKKRRRKRRKKLCDSYDSLSLCIYLLGFVSTSLHFPCHWCSLPSSVPVFLPLLPHCVLADCRMKRS